MSRKSKQLVMSHVPVEILRPNPWNTNHVSPENEAKIEASLSRFGFVRPLIVRDQDDSDFLEILGGQHRWQVAARMGFATVPVINLGSIDDKTAKEIGLVDNGRYGEDDTLELASLLKGLGNVDELSTFLPYTGAEFDEIFSATDIDLDELGMPDAKNEGSLEDLVPAAPTSQIMRFKVPLGDAPAIEKLIEATMKSQGFTGGDSLANAGDALVHLLRGRNA